MTTGNISEEMIPRFWVWVLLYGHYKPIWVTPTMLSNGNTAILNACCYFLQSLWSKKKKHSNKQNTICWILFYLFLYWHHYRWDELHIAAAFYPYWYNKGSSINCCTPTPLHSGYLYCPVTGCGLTLMIYMRNVNGHLNTTKTFYFNTFSQQTKLWGEMEWDGMLDQREDA